MSFPKFAAFRNEGRILRQVVSSRETLAELAECKGRLRGAIIVLSRTFVLYCKPLPTEGHAGR